MGAALGDRRSMLLHFAGEFFPFSFSRSVLLSAWFLPSLILL